jgi:hypothetical protein
MNIGDHLVTPRTGYTHHGIYIGNEQVIHYSGFANGQSTGTICITSVKAFANGHDVSVQKHFFRFYNDEESVERAHSRLGEDWYNVLINNCEHFVNWCITGLHDSPQVRAAIKAISVTYELSKAKAKTEMEKMRRTEVVQIESIVPVQLIHKELERIAPKTTPPIVQNMDIAEIVKSLFRLF